MGSLDTIRKLLRKAGLHGIEARAWRRSVMLEGRAASWDDYLKAGFLAAKRGYKGVVNDIEVAGIEKPALPVPATIVSDLAGQSFDVVIIGGGIIGCAVARELARMKLSIALFEKNEDVAKHASGRNAGMIHPGFAPKPGSKKALYNTRGNRLWRTVAGELGIDYRIVGSLVLYRSRFTHLLNPYFRRRARLNDVDGYEIISRAAVIAKEPHVTRDQYGALYLHSTGVLSPYRATIAYAENAVENGVRIELNTAVTGFAIEGGRIVGVRTNRGTVRAALIINAAGMWSDVVAGLAGDRFFTIHPRKGVEAILDIKTGRLQKHVIGMPGILQIRSRTKGGGVIPTVEGNLLVGPTAEEVPRREDYSTKRSDIDELAATMSMNTHIGKGDIITYFAGTRACTFEEDLIVEASEHVENLVHAAGIQSPGFAGAPAIAEDVAAIAKRLLERHMKVEVNDRFDPVQGRRGRMFSRLSFEEKAAAVRANPSYGRIICRCETVSEGEVADELASPLPPATLDGIKRRTRVGAGRCQGGFCAPRVMEIVAQANGTDLTAITKKGGKSTILCCKTKGAIDYAGVRTKNERDR